MITYIYGKDRFRIKEYLASHAKDADHGIEALKYRGLFGDQRPVIITDLPEDFKIKDEKDLTVFIVYPEDARGKKKANALVFDRLEENELRTYIKKKVTEAGYEISAGALGILIQNYRDSWQIALELEKLFCYASETKLINEESLRAIANFTITENIFQLTDAISEQNKKDAILLIDRHLASGAEAPYLFSMFVWIFRAMLAPDRKGVAPFVAQKARIAAQRYGLERLKNCYRSLLELERAWKQGKVDLTDGLYRFVFSLPSR